MFQPNTRVINIQNNKPGIVVKQNEDLTYLVSYDDGVLENEIEDDLEEEIIILDEPPNIPVDKSVGSGGGGLPLGKVKIVENFLPGQRVMIGNEKATVIRKADMDEFGMDLAYNEENYVVEFDKGNQKPFKNVINSMDFSSGKYRYIASKNDMKKITDAAAAAIPAIAADFRGSVPGSSIYYILQEKQDKKPLIDNDNNRINGQFLIENKNNAAELISKDKNITFALTLRMNGIDIMNYFQKYFSLPFTLQSNYTYTVKYDSSSEILMIDTVLVPRKKKVKIQISKILIQQALKENSLELFYLLKKTVRAKSRSSSKK
jgi:hypothetical protein